MKWTERGETELERSGLSRAVTAQSYRDVCAFSDRISELAKGEGVSWEGQLRKLEIAIDDAVE